jgi:hypothetical protein
VPITACRTTVLSTIFYKIMGHADSKAGIHSNIRS